MTDRTTRRDLEKLVERLNTATGNAIEPWALNKQGKYRAVVGVYYIEGAYSGVKLVQVVNEGGGARDVSGDGYGTKKLLHHFLESVLFGIIIGRTSKPKSKRAA